MRFTSMLVAAGFFCVGLAAEEIMKINEIDDFVKPPKSLAVKDGVFSLKGAWEKCHSENFKVEAGKVYRLSGEYRAMPGSQGVYCYFGFTPYDAKGRRISAYHVTEMNPKTETKLAVAAKKGDRSVRVVNAEAWNAKTRHGHIAFDVKSDYSDLPNFDQVYIQSGKVTRNGDSWLIGLSAPLMKDYPAGTAVRQHCDGADFHYCRLAKMTPEWVKFSRDMKGFSQKGSQDLQWRRGTVSATLSVMVGSGAKAGIEFKNLKVEEVK